MSNQLTIQQVTQAMPPNLKGMVTQEYVDKINNIVTDPIVAEQVRENFISYTRVLQEGKFKTQDYLNAVTYVSFKLMGLSNQDAYFKTFPDRHASLVAAGTSPKDISSYVSMYNKGKLVNLILEQTLVPSWVLNADNYQKAINVQVELMMTAQSEKVRSDAANSLLTHLAKPKEAGPLINLNLQETSGMKDLKDLMERLAGQQQSVIQGGGMSARDIAHQKLVQDGEDITDV